MCICNCRRICVCVIADACMMIKNNDCMHAGADSHTNTRLMIKNNGCMHAGADSHTNTHKHTLDDQVPTHTQSHTIVCLTFDDQKQ